MAFQEFSRFANGTVICEMDVTATTIRSIRVTNNGTRTVVAQVVNSPLGARFRAEFAPGTVVTRNIPAAMRAQIQFVNEVEADTGLVMKTLPGWQIQCSYVDDPVKVASL